MLRRAAHEHSAVAGDVGLLPARRCWASAESTKTRSPTTTSRWVRSHFIDYVRAGGPLPALRVGKQPYGVLPVTSLDAWKPKRRAGAQSGRDIALRDFLIRLRDLWRRNVTGRAAPRPQEDTDRKKGSTRTCAEVLSMDGLSSSYSIRNLMGRQYLEHLWTSSLRRLLRGHLRTSWRRHPQERLALIRLRTMKRRCVRRRGGPTAAQAATPLASAGAPDAGPIARAVYRRRSGKLRGALVQAEHGSPLTPNYIELLLAARNLDAIRNETVSPAAAARAALLLLRHSMLLEYSRRRFAAADQPRTLQPALRREPELVNSRQSATIDANRLASDGDERSPYRATRSPSSRQILTRASRPPANPTVGQEPT